MSTSLSERLGLGPRELVSIVGAGGKTTILLTLGRELAQAGHRTILTTTTNLAADQVKSPAVHGSDPAMVDASFLDDAPLFVVAGNKGRKADGLTPQAVDRLFSDTSADYVIAEADGARAMSIKAPADHEPVIPSLSTTVIVVMGADALGRPITEVAHRPERIAELTGAEPDGMVTFDLATAVLLHPDGGLKGIPEHARIVIAITNVSDDGDGTIEALTRSLANHPSVDITLALLAVDNGDPETA